MKVRKRIAAAIIVVIISLLAAGCGAAELTRPNASAEVDQIEVSGSCAIEKQDGRIIVSGTTDLMDGVILAVTLNSPTGEEFAKRVFAKSGDDISEEFTIGADTAWPDAVHGFIICAPEQYGKQPDYVTQNYGKKFENLVGDVVIWGAEGVIVAIPSPALSLSAKD